MQDELNDFKMHAEGGRAILNNHVIGLNDKIDQLIQEKIQLERQLASHQNDAEVRIGEEEAGRLVCTNSRRELGEVLVRPF